jgi:hypothetical protein
MRVAVIGDIAGHLVELQHELLRLGAGENGRLPDDLCVIQVGDLIHRGPASEGVIDLVDRYLAEQPEQWIQLMGNHEACYVREPQFCWNDRLPRRAARTLRRWWREGLVHLATSVRTENESFLITHAGVTETFWREVLGEPTTAEQTADLINEQARQGTKAIFRGGQILHGGDPEPKSGPLWTDCATELLPGWKSKYLPFSQIYGHSTMMDWKQVRQRDSVETRMPLRVDAIAKHEEVLLDGGRLVGIDPGHDVHPVQPWRSFEVIVPSEPEMRSCVC